VKKTVKHASFQQMPTTKYWEDNCKTHMLATNASCKIMDRQMEKGTGKLTYPSFHTKSYA
jgi:hypothetical protein